MYLLVGTFQARHQTGGTVASEPADGDAIAEGLGALLRGPRALGALLALALARLVLESTKK